MPDNPGAQATLYEEPVWLAHLNPAQREAVTLPMDSHGAILAGAGTGKTNVLTHRIAYAIRGGMEPNAIVAVTFTNKAAKEIKERIARLVGEEAAGKIRLGTFHSLGLKFLRKFGHHIGLERCETAAPMDEDEAVALLRRDERPVSRYRFKSREAQRSLLCHFAMERTGSVRQRYSCPKNSKRQFYPDAICRV
jgi:Superfamily I DNA and RNA helicases